MPVYLVFALFTGGLLLATILALSGAAVSNMAGFGALLGPSLLWRLKRHCWRDIDRGRLPVTRASALGLPELAPRTCSNGRTPKPTTSPGNGFRPGAQALAQAAHRMAVILFALVPALCALPVWFIVHLDAAPWLLAASLSALAGTLVERWLFFAEAKHLVTLYY